MIRDDMDFWNYLVSQVAPANALDFFDKWNLQSDGVGLTADLGDRRVMKWFKEFFADNEEGVFDERLLGYLDRFTATNKTRKADLIGAALDRCADRQGDREEEVKFFRMLVYKELITSADVRICLKEMRARGLYELIPLLYLLDNGEMDTYTADYYADFM